MNTASTAPSGETIKTAQVHKQGEPGFLTIDFFTGWVVPQEEKPSWAEGLVAAQFSERHLFYQTRLGEGYAQEHKTPELYAFEDLGWLALNTEASENADNDGEELIIDADEEFRMGIVAAVVGISREVTQAHADDGHVEGAETVLEIARDNQRTEAEMKDFNEAQEAGYKEANG